MLLLNKNITFKNIHKDPNLEIMSIDIKYGKKIIRLIIVYIPDPKTNVVKQYLKEIKPILNFPGTCVLIGDFNINFSSINNASVEDKFYILKTFISKHQPLFQLIDKPTRENHIIDLLFVIKIIL